MLHEQHFRQLAKEVKAVTQQATWLEQHGYELLVFGFRLLLFIGGIVLLNVGATVWLQGIGLIVASFGYYGIAITGTHETKHNSFTKSNRINTILGYFFSDFWAGQSSQWWHYRHVQKHHIHTNVPSKEEESFYYPWIHAVAYFFVLPYFVGGWLFVRSVIHLRSKPKDLLLFLVLQTLGYAFFIALLAFTFPLWQAVILVLVLRALFAPVFLHLAIFNHIGLEHFEEQPAWLPHQTITTRNVKDNWFLAGIGGNSLVHCHIEHHLFPSLSCHMLKKVRPIVKTFLANHNYNYHEDGYYACLKKSLKHYKHIFGTSPIPFDELV